MPVTLSLIRTSSGPVYNMSALNQKHWVFAQRTWFRDRDVFNGQRKVRSLVADHTGLACLGYIFCHDYGSIATEYRVGRVLNRRYEVPMPKLKGGRYK